VFSLSIHVFILLKWAWISKSSIRGFLLGPHHDEVALEAFKGTNVNAFRQYKSTSGGLNYIWSNMGVLFFHEVVFSNVIEIHAQVNNLIPLSMKLFKCHRSHVNNITTPLIIYKIWHFLPPPIIFQGILNQSLYLWYTLYLDYSIYEQHYTIWLKIWLWYFFR